MRSYVVSPRGVVDKISISTPCGAYLMTKMLGNTDQLVDGPSSVASFLLWVMPVRPEVRYSGWKGSVSARQAVFVKALFYQSGIPRSLQTRCKRGEDTSLEKSKSETVNESGIRMRNAGVAGWVHHSPGGAGGSDVECSGYRTVEDSRTGCPLRMHLSEADLRTKSK